MSICVYPFLKIVMKENVFKEVTRHNFDQIKDESYEFKYCLNK